MKNPAIENMHEAGIEIVLVTTIVDNVNNDQVGRIVEVRDGKPQENFLRLLPARFRYRTRRGNHSPERRIQAYALSHLAKDVSNQVGKVEPTRDWFPISFISTFAASPISCTVPIRSGVRSPAAATRIAASARR